MPTRVRHVRCACLAVRQQVWISSSSSTSSEHLCEAGLANKRTAQLDESFKSGQGVQHVGLLALQIASPIEIMRKFFGERVWRPYTCT